ncbi:unnamed protein product, partial [Prorocentrum cordatum]
KFLRDIIESGPNDKIFGDVANWRRLLERCIKDYVGVIRTPENPLPEDAREAYDDTPEYLIIRKQLTASLDIARAWVKANRSWDASFISQYKSTLVFLQSDPVAPNPLPSWMRQRYLTVMVQEASTASMIWPLLAPEALESIGYVGCDRQRKVTLDMVKMKVLQLTGDDSPDTWMDTLMDFMGTFPGNAGDDLVNDAALMKAGLGILKSGVASDESLKDAQVLLKK